MHNVLMSQKCLKGIDVLILSAKQTALYTKIHRHSQLLLDYKSLTKGTHS